MTLYIIALLIITMLNLDISCFENIADPDQLVSENQQHKKYGFHQTCLQNSIDGLLAWFKPKFKQKDSFCTYG